MRKRRHGLNPAKVKADLAALEAEPPREVFQPRLDIRRRLSVVLLFLLSGSLLVISFAPVNLWYLAYVALVPWGLAVVGGNERWWSLLWAYLGGVAFWALGLHWLSWVTPAGFVLAAMYLGLYWLAAAVFVRRAFERRWPIWVVLPVVWVALEYVRGSWIALSGFPWFFLAHSQWANIRLIQISDLTGQYGVSFFVAMVNGAVIDALAQPLFVRSDGGGRRTLKILVGAVACLVAGAFLWSYGAVRLGEKTTRPGPTVGVVQLAFPISLYRPTAPTEEIFARHVDNSRGLFDARCDLVVWPESMLGYYDMDPAVWFARDPERKDPSTDLPRYTPEQREIIRRYHADLRSLQRLLGELGCPLLAGGATTHPTETDLTTGRPLTTNSALLFDRDEKGRIRLVAQYDKMHLVPFSERVPFRRGFPGLHRLLRRCVPDVMPQLQPGRRPVRFRIRRRGGDRDGQDLHFAAPICYEGVFARVCRRLVMQDGRKQADVLVNISNDGWFIFPAGGRTHASTELEQHLVQYVFRAVECRVPVVRAVNTGISAHIDSNGRIVQVVEHGGRRKMVGGNIVARTVVDGRVSVYSLVGDVFALVVSGAACAGAAVLLLLRRRAKKE